MLREESFSKRSKLISELEVLSETFRQMNVSDHPAVKAMIADKQKQFEEDHKEELKNIEDEERQQPMKHGIPDDMLREKRFDETQRDGEKTLEDSVMDYISKNFVTEEEKGEEDEEEDLDWAENVDQKEEL